MVFVLDKNRKPLDPCCEARARKLLDKGRAAVIRHYPFTIIINDRTVEESVVHGHRVKIDPGSKVTGIAVVQEQTGQVVAAIELEHRGERIKKAMSTRRLHRDGRRFRKTRYRKPRFDNRKPSLGWLPPSMESRVANMMTWVIRLLWLCPVEAFSQELVKFDLQKLENPEITDVEYRQGTLFGYDVREYLLEKWHRKCAYCGAEGIPLQIEHILAKSKGGTDRISNLCLACKSCNKRKGNRPIAEFLADRPEVLAKIKTQARNSLKDATAVNATRWELFRRLQATGLPVETGSGGCTKFNRMRRELPKAHWIDAACVGKDTAMRLNVEGIKPLLVRAMGHGLRQRCSTDKYGFPKCHRSRTKFFMGFQTGDIVRANIPKGKYQGEHKGRIVTRNRPKFSLQGFNVHPKYIQKIHCADGYDYSFGAPLITELTNAIPRYRKEA